MITFSISKNTKLQVLFLRANEITNDVVKSIALALKPDPAQPTQGNKTLKVLDISYNPITRESLNYIAETMETNRTLEYLGLAKCKFENEDLYPIFHSIGKIPFPADQVDAHQAKLKQRDVIIEKNKKLKASKKPEEPVPIIDNIEQATITNSDG